MDFSLFIKYCKKYIKDDEKGKVQTFLDHFFMALGYTDGYKVLAPIANTVLIMKNENYIFC